MRKTVTPKLRPSSASNLCDFPGKDSAPWLVKWGWVIALQLKGSMSLSWFCTKLLWKHLFCYFYCKSVWHDHWWHLKTTSLQWSHLIAQDQWLLVPESWPQEGHLTRPHGASLLPPLPSKRGVPRDGRILCGPEPDHVTGLSNQEGSPCRGLQRGPTSSSSLLGSYYSTHSGKFPERQPCGNGADC